MNEDPFERLARSSFDHLSAGAGQRQSRAEGHHLVAEPCRRICVRDAGGCLASSIIKPMVDSMGLSTRSALNLDGTQTGIKRW